MLATIHSFAISLALGLLIGADRERSHPEGIQSAGVRTFGLIGLLGTISAFAGSSLLAIEITCIVFSLIALGYLRSTRNSSEHNDIGITTEISAVMVFALGYLAFTERGLATLLGGMILLILVSRHWLHQFVRKTLLPAEINAAVTLLVFVMVAVPFLPNRTVDPFGLINPNRLALLAAVIAGMQFSGYVAQRALGQKRGLLLSGFLGGLVSSTAVFATLPAQLKLIPEGVRPVAASAVLATVATLVELLVILFSASSSLGQSLAFPILAMISTGLVFAWIFARRAKANESMPSSLNPLDVRAVLKLWLIVGGMLFVIAAVQKTYGSRAVGIATFLGGLFEVHGVSLATATLHFQGKMTLPEASIGIGTAVIASFISKWGLLWGLSGRKLAIQVSFALLGILLSGVATYAIFCG